MIYIIFLLLLGVYFTNYTGIDVKTITDLRKSFRESNVEYVVSKNTLTKRAAKEAGYENLDEILTGQVAIAYSEDPTAPARIIKEFKKENEDLLDVLGLIFDGELYPSNKYIEFANLPSKNELLTKFVIMLNSPMTILARTLSSPMGNFVNVLNSLKNEKSE